MHAKVGRDAGAGDEALVFTALRGAPPIRTQEAAPASSAYGANRKPNWPAIVAIAAAHALLLIALVKFDVITVKPKARPLTVIDIAAPAPPPADEPPAPKPEPVEVVSQIVTPPPVVTTSIVSPPPLAVTPPPQKAAPPLPAPPAGPVAIGNLEERLLEGEMPRYPFESRRRKEEGTTMLRLLIGTDGRVVDVSIAQSCGYARLDEAILKAARKWRWQPMVRNGAPVEVRGVMPFTWKLT